MAVTLHNVNKSARFLFENVFEAIRDNKKKS